MQTDTKKKKRKKKKERKTVSECRWTCTQENQSLCSSSKKMAAMKHEKSRIFYRHISLFLSLSLCLFVFPVLRSSIRNMLVGFMLFSALLEVSLLSGEPQKFFATLQDLFSFGWWFRKPSSQTGRFLAAEVIKIIHVKCQNCSAFNEANETKKRWWRYLSARGISNLGSEGSGVEGVFKETLVSVVLVWIWRTDSDCGSSIMWWGDISTPSRIFSTVHSTDLVILRSSTIRLRGKCGNSCCTCLIR